MNIWTGIIGVAGALRLSDDGKWYMPYEADFGAGLLVDHVIQRHPRRRLQVRVGRPVGGVALPRLQDGLEQPVEKLIMSGPAIGARFAW